MRNHFSFVIIIFMALLWLSAYTQGKPKECKGFFRWDVKTLTDSTGPAIISEVSSDSTISQLISVNPPKMLRIFSKKDSHLPRFTSEKYLVKVIAIIEDIQKKGDQDFHVVLKDPKTGDFMIGEIPDPDCSSLIKFPVLQEKYREIRQQGENLKTLLKKNRKPLLVEITGVPFWDARHWWLFRSAKNGREIHPILGIRILE